MSTTPDGADIERIGQIAINVKDLDRAVSFYRDTLGLAYLFSIPTAAFFDCGGVRLMLGKAETAELDHAASIIYYLVGDIQGSYSRIKATGAQFIDEPHLLARMPDHELWMTFLRDSEDNVIGLMSEVRA